MVLPGATKFHILVASPFFSDIVQFERGHFRVDRQEAWHRFPVTRSESSFVEPECPRNSSPQRAKSTNIESNTNGKRGGLPALRLNGTLSDVYQN